MVILGDNVAVISLPALTVDGATSVGETIRLVCQTPDDDVTLSISKEGRLLSTSTTATGERVQLQ